MRYLPLLLLLLLAACSSQGRDDYDSHWDNPETTAPRHTYDEDYVPPSRMNADQLVARAARAEQVGRDDEARVDYQQAFRRDRWNVSANAGYQDLMLRNGLFDTVWQEYLDLQQQHPARGDALWFHLRPMLAKRAEEPIQMEKHKKLDDKQIAQINKLTADSAAKSKSGDRDGAVAAIDDALKIADFPALHRVRIELLHESGYDTLLKEYADRADDNPASGDNLYLHARVLAYKDPRAALEMLRDGWVLDLPGWWLRFGIGEISREVADAQFKDAQGGDQAAKRSCRGYYAVAQAFMKRCLQARPNDPDTLQTLGWATAQRKRLD